MPEPPANSLTFGTATLAELRAALELLFNRLDDAMRPLQIAAAADEIDRTGGEGQFFYVARRGPALAAAIWIQLLPGHVASLWQPGLGPGESTATATTLIDLATAKAAAAGVRLVQTLAETDAGPSAAWLRQCGFKYTADLLYLVSGQDKFPQALPPSELIFESLAATAETTVSATQTARLAAVVQRTYVNTQDCPAIHGMRTPDDVLATYRTVGTFNPSRWFFVRHNNADIGCLLLADHPQHLQCELVYMGLASEARGRGWGVEVVRFAQWQARQANYDGKHAERMVLAVDAANSPAISMYAAAGFETWDRRSVFLREIPEAH
jgi:GNAT superfamily N-acetyltransferase